MNPAPEVMQFEQLYQGLYAPNFAKRSSHITPESLVEQLRRPERTDTPIMQLECVGLLQRWLSDLEAEFVPRARAEGASWFDIGKSLGCTRQAAWARYRTAEDESSSP